MNDNRRVVADFLQWWTDPQKEFGYPKCLAEDASFNRELGLVGEDRTFYQSLALSDREAILFIQESLGHREVRVTSEAYEGERASVELTCVDPVTLLRHRIQFEFLLGCGLITSVTERDEIVE